MEKIFLIGGSGFIGKNLVRCLSPYYQISISTSILIMIFCRLSFCKCIST